MFCHFQLALKGRHGSKKNYCVYIAGEWVSEWENERKKVYHDMSQIVQRALLIIPTFHVQT
jgi:hypothetical protein